MAKKRHGLDIVTKLCPKCRQGYVGEKAIELNFHKDRSRTDGLKVYCNTCRNGEYKERKRREPALGRKAPGRDDILDALFRLYLGHEGSRELAYFILDSWGMMGE